MTRVSKAGMAIALLCALMLGACGGGGGGASAPQGSPPPPPSPASPPPPPPPPPSSLTPLVFIEKDNAGVSYIRVTEQVFNPFSASSPPQRTLIDRVLNTGRNTVIEGPLTTRIENVDVTQRKTGLQLMDTLTTSIYDYTFYDWVSDDIYGAAIKIGDNSRATDGITYIQRVTADGLEQPDSSYSISNTDFIGIEGASFPVYIRDVTGRGFGDASVDTKATETRIMNATFNGGNRVIRAWQNADVVIVNSIINAAPGKPQLWIKSTTTTVRYFNTLWCENAANPSPSDPNCRADPWLIQGEDIAVSTAMTRVQRISSNTLAPMSFFRSQIDQIVVEYTTNNGTSWTRMNLPNTGASGSAPVGDLRWRIPLTLSNGTYRFRAYYMKSGARIGNTSAVVDEAGVIVR